MRKQQPVRRLGFDAIHTCWDNSLEPRLTVHPGESVVFNTREPSLGQMARRIASGEIAPAGADVIDLVVRDAAIPRATGQGTASSGHALTGPVAIVGAEPGDTLVVQIISVECHDWGWTHCGPGGQGPLRHELDGHYVHLWDLRSSDIAMFSAGIGVPLAPFCGVMGVAHAEPGQLPTSPPGIAGGNMDIRQLVAGSTLYLPVQVPGALFSVGDVHAAQGDGEVAGTGIEMDAAVTLHFELEKNRSIARPELIAVAVEPSAGPWFATTGHDADVVEATRQALHGMIRFMGKNHGLDRAQSLVLASACVDLKISQIVNAGIFTVSAFIPLSVFSHDREFRPLVPKTAR